jgi:hypothetical protein
MFKTRSIPYWTTIVVSSTATNDERRIIELPYECRMIDSRLTLLDRTNFQQIEYKSPCITVPLLVCFPVFIRLQEEHVPNRYLTTVIFRVYSLQRARDYRNVA